MSEKVGEIYYDVTMDTRGLVNGQRQVDRELKNTTKSLDDQHLKLTALAAATAALAAGYAALRLSAIADEWGQYDSRMKMATKSAEEHAHAQDRMRSSANETFRAISETREAFIQMSPVLRSMGLSLDQSIDAIDAFSGLLVTNAASAEKGSSAMDALSKAIQKGKIDGDAWASIASTMPSIIDLIATTTGKTTAEIRKLGVEGKLSVNDLTRSLVEGNAAVMASVREMPTTFKDALQNLNNGISEYLGRVNKAGEVTATLAEITNGAGEVMAQLANQMAEVNAEAANLGKDQSVRSWADATKISLSYLADAADVVWQTISVLGRNVAFVFGGIGREIGGIGAQVGAVLRGDFAGAKAIGEAMVADSESRRAELDAKDAKTLDRAKLAGQKMREAWEQGNSGAASGGGGKVKLKPVTDAAADKKAADEARRFATRALAAREYYEGLVIENKTALDKIDAEETKALTENDKRRVADGGNAEIYAKARVEIQKKYSFERLQLARKTADDLAELENRNEQARAEARILLTKSTEQRILLVRDESMRQAEASYKRGQLTFEEAETAKTKAIELAIEQRKALELSRQSIVLGTLQIKASGGAMQDQENYVIAQATAEMAALEELRLLDLERSQLYADQKVAIEARMQEDILNIRAQGQQAQIAGASQIATALSSIARGSAGEQSGLFKAMFAAQKAFAIASAIVNIQTAMSSAAMSLPFPANLAAMGIVAANTASIISTISGTNYGGARQYGGPASAGSMYRVNETGAPEMFTGSNGQQYMLPTKSGQVTAADQVGGGKVEWRVIINGAPPGTTATIDESSKTVEIAVAQVADQIANNEGPVWRAMRGSTNVRSAL